MLHELDVHSVSDFGSVVGNSALTQDCNAMAHSLTRSTHRCIFIVHELSVSNPCTPLCLCHPQPGLAHSNPWSAHDPDRETMQELCRARTDKCWQVFAKTTDHRPRRDKTSHTHALKKAVFWQAFAISHRWFCSPLPCIPRRCSTMQFSSSSFRPCAAGD
jgi:hypothetical protein